VYPKFSFNDLENKTVFIHELNILRPTHLIFLSGKGYDEHIIRNFGKNFYKELEEAIKNTNSKSNPVSDKITLKSEKVNELFGIENYGDLKIIYATHPSAPMEEKIRDIYNKCFKEFN
jgi:hypothetical protein